MGVVLLPGERLRPEMAPRLYLAGPMTGMPECNYPAFNAAATRLRALGFDVLNPAEMNGGDRTRAWSYYLQRNIAALARGADAIAVMPGWQESRGATLEVDVAQGLGLPVVDAETLEPAQIADSVLAEAIRLTRGPRRQAYGHPLDDYTRTATLWSAVLGVEVTAEQAILCMVMVKVSRECNLPKRDNRVDMAGYVACLDEVIRERERRAKATEEADAKV